MNCLHFEIIFIIWSTMSGWDHGIDISNPYFRAWIAGVPVLHLVLTVVFRGLGLWKYPTAKKGTRSSDMVAFLIAAGLAVTGLGIGGAIIWFKLFGVNDYDLLIHDKYYGRSIMVESLLSYPMLIYQGWNFICCVLINDLRDPFMIGHHFVTCLLAYFSLHPYLHYAALYFMGLAELSNIPLTLIEVFESFPALAATFPLVYELSRYTFVVSFLLLRIVFWLYYSIDFWQGSLSLLIQGTAHSNFVVGFFLFSHVFLTGLQFFWGIKILRMVVEAFSPKKGQ